MAWLAKLDARSLRWPRILRAGYLTLKWGLVSLGAYLFVGHYITTWGWAAGLWFLLAPLAFGLYQGLTARPQPPAP